MAVRTYVAVYLCRRDERAVRQFLKDREIPEEAIRKELHMTIYRADCVFGGLSSFDEEMFLDANVDETRFMVMAIGGEVPQPHLDPDTIKIGIRLTRRNQATAVIDETRLQFANLETPELLGDRSASTARRSAFGAPEFKPHITLLNPGSGVGTDLTALGQAFRSQFKNLVFDRLEVRVHTTFSPDDDD
jgi:hypothetical protein